MVAFFVSKLPVGTNLEHFWPVGHHFNWGALTGDVE